MSQYTQRIRIVKTAMRSGQPFGYVQDRPATGRVLSNNIKEVVAPSYMGSIGRPAQAQYCCLLPFSGPVPYYVWGELDYGIKYKFKRIKYPT